MPQPNRPEDELVPSSRKPGRSFEHHDRPLGEELLATSPPSSGALEQGVYGRAEGSDEAPQGVAERAKAISVLRKADELMRFHNPAPTTPHGIHRALELAAGRVGLTYDEYRTIVRRDPALQALEKRVIESAARHG